MQDSKILNVLVSTNTKQKRFFIPQLNRKVKLYNLTDVVYKYYTTRIKNNNNNLYKAQKKLTRNILLGTEIKCKNKYHKKYKYGNLTIVIDSQLHTIINLENHCTGKSEMPVNKIYKKELNQIFKL